MEIYSALVLCFVIFKFNNMRKNIPMPRIARDGVPGMIAGLFYLIGPRTYQVQSEYKRFSAFYVDPYGLWIFKNYLYLILLTVVFPLLIVVILKLLETTRKASR
jgi:hypothetical protein